MFFYGDEHDDMVEERKEFLAKMVEVGFLHFSEAPTPEVASAFPSSVPLSMSDIRDKTVHCVV